MNNYWHSHTAFCVSTDMPLVFQAQPGSSSLGSSFFMWHAGVTHSAPGPTRPCSWQSTYLNRYRSLLINGPCRRQNSSFKGPLKMYHSLPGQYSPHMEPELQKQPVLNQIIYISGYSVYKSLGPPIHDSWCYKGCFNLNCFWMKRNTGQQGSQSEQRKFSLYRLKGTII